MKNEETGSDIKKFDLLQHSAAASSFRDRRSQVIFQIPAVFLLVLVLFAGFFGIQSSNKNLATISIWVIWWPLLIISLALAGRIWCFMCPFGAVGDRVQHHAIYKKVNECFSLERKWPLKFRNLSLAALFFIVITWIDFQFNLVNSPLNTAYFIAALLALIVIISIIFERRSFCRYVCPVTGLIGLYSMFAPFELRAKAKETCKICREKYCISGNDNGYSCPVFEYPGTMEKNTYCILCTECVKTCRRNNISFNLRSFGGDFLALKRTGADEALFILILAGVTIFQSVIMIRPWAVFTRDLMIYTGADYDSIRLILFISAASIPIIMYSIAIAISKLSSPGMNFKDIFTGFAYSIIPLALMMHLSHNIRHLLEEGTGIIPVLSDPFGFGWNIFGSSGNMPSPIMGSSSILLLQWMLMFTGLGFSVSAVKRISHRMFRTNAYIPVLIFLFFFFVLDLWVFSQPTMHKH